MRNMRACLEQPSGLLLLRRVTHGRLDGFDIVHTGTSRFKTFTYACVDQGVIEGWASLTDSALQLRTSPEPLVFRFLTPCLTPGGYSVALDEDVHTRYKRS